MHDPTTVKEVDSTNDTIQYLCSKSIVEKIIADQIRDTPVAHECHQNTKIATCRGNIPITANETVMTMLLIELLLSQEHFDFVDALVRKEVAAFLVINKRNMAIEAATKCFECEKLAWFIFAKQFIRKVEES